MIKHIKGDLFSTDSKLIAHGVNCQGVMGAGVAKIVKNKYPKAYLEYKENINDHKLNNSNPLGSINFVYTDTKIIANCFTQESYGRCGKFVSYDALDNVFGILQDYCWLNDIDEISMPMIGAGFGGGNWEIIEEIIDQNMMGIRVKVYKL